MSTKNASSLSQQHQDVQPSNTAQQTEQDRKTLGYKNQYINKQDIQKPQHTLHVLEDLCSLDSELIQLIGKRIRMLSKLPKTGLSNYEKTLRTSWEKNTTTISNDPCFIRQLFNLLQELEVSKEAMEQAYAFSLTPKNKPVQVCLPLPTCFRITQLYMALAACSGAEGKLQPVLLNDPVIECLKALNQAGASLRWEEEGYITFNKTTPFTNVTTLPIDKVIHIGGDSLSLYLLIFLTVIRQARIKFIGKSSLKLTSVSQLRNFLPLLGARLTNTIPKQEGLPIRIEASAMLPSKIIIPKELPKDAVVALFMATPGWDKEITIKFADHPEATAITHEVFPLLQRCHISVKKIYEGETFLGICVTPSPVVLPKNPHIEAYILATANLLALPLFTGGTVTLQKSPQQDTTNLHEALELLTQAGLTITETTETLCSNYNKDRTIESTLTDLSTVSDELFPLALTISMIPVIKAKSGKIPHLPDHADILLIESYLAQLGLSHIETQLKKTIPTQNPWASPSANWGLALSLAAFLRPQIKLSNPGCVESLFPRYWRIYNNLSTPENLIPPIQKHKEQTQHIEKTSSRRRIMATT